MARRRRRGQARGWRRRRRRRRRRGRRGRQPGERRRGPPSLSCSSPNQTYWSNWSARKWVKTRKRTCRPSWGTRAGWQQPPKLSFRQSVARLHPCQEFQVAIRQASGKLSTIFAKPFPSVKRSPPRMMRRREFTEETKSWNRKICLDKRTKIALIYETISIQSKQSYSFKRVHDRSQAHLIWPWQKWVHSLGSIWTLGNPQQASLRLWPWGSDPKKVLWGPKSSSRMPKPFLPPQVALSYHHIYVCILITSQELSSSKRLVDSIL